MEMEYRPSGRQDVDQDQEMLTAAEMKQLSDRSWRYLNHLESFREPHTEGFGVESPKALFSKIKGKVLAGEPALVACVGPSASGKSTLKDLIEVVTKTDGELRRYRRNRRVSTPVFSTQWSDLIRAYSAVTGAPVEFGRLSEDVKSGVSRLGVHEIANLYNKMRGQHVPAVIIADFPGYPGNRGEEMARYIAENDGFVFAPWGEHHLYVMAARIRDMARNTDSPEELAHLLENLGIPVVGDPVKVHRRLAQDCAPGFAVRDMQSQMINLAVQLSEKGSLNTYSGRLPLHQDYGNEYYTAMLQDPLYTARVMGNHVIPTILQEWGFDSSQAFVGYNTRMLGTPIITEDILNSIR